MREVLGNSEILIVGAGPSGLAALKEMREAGFQAITVDSRANFGGVFAPESGVTFEDLHLTTSNLFMSFSDFPAHDVDKGVKYWSKEEYFDYLSRYVEYFNLRPYIQLETTVNEAQFDDNSNHWKVNLASNASGSKRESEFSETFNKLIVASGANHTPNLPGTFEKFDGEVLHSADYYSAEQVKGKKVLVVGMGEGSADVACSAAKTAESVAVWSRRYPDCAPRFVDPFLEDSDYDEHEHLDNYYDPDGFLESLTITRSVRNLPLAVWSFALQNLLTGLRKKHGLNSMQGMARALTERAWASDYFSSDTSQVPTKSAMTLSAAANHLVDIVIAPEIDIRESTLSFRNASLFGAAGGEGAADATELESYDLDADVIVACTGFNLNFDWISLPEDSDELNTNPRTWFKHCFPADWGDSLAFVGFARPHSGGIPQCSEMVSRYIAQLYKGNLKLPENYAQLALEDGAAEEACFHLTPHYKMVVDYSAYMMSVAKLIGCTPRDLPRFSAPLDAVKYWTFPMWPCFFRTRGVGAKPEAADAVISKFGPFDSLTPSPLIFIQLIFGLIMPLVNLFSWLVKSLSPRRSTIRGLPRLYKWRMSKLNFLYHNSLTFHDFKFAFTQWLAVAFITGYLTKKGLASLLNKFLRASAKPEETPAN